MPENVPDSPSSGDDVASRITDEPSPKKSKRGAHKRVVSVPIGDVEGSRSRGESYPPSDSWTWRKYGQKPIKGSPYPRGYYRCSSSKGCPARKQVERSRVDPTTLIVTYASDHTHPLPSKPATSPSPGAGPEPEPEKPVQLASEDDAVEEEEDSARAPFSRDVLLGCGFEIAGEWFDDVASTAVLASPIYAAADDDVASAFAAVMSGEDESLFADLGELPECAVVFRRRIEIQCCGSTE